MENMISAYWNYEKWMKIWQIRGRRVGKRKKREICILDDKMEKIGRKLFKP